MGYNMWITCMCKDDLISTLNMLDHIYNMKPKSEITQVPLFSPN